MSREPSLPPCPPLLLHFEVPPDPQAPLDCLSLPPRPGVFVFRDEEARTITIAATANLRRLVRSRLQPIQPDDSPSRRINYRQTVRSVAAMTVGSAFEADWAYLQLARRFMPHSYRGLLDRWKGWFVHINPTTNFPRWVKTASPGGGKSSLYLGPMADKHAAQRFIEMLDDAFDLCRYHHILIEAPHATACVYKEMGKCPAPCDGSISMDAYRRQVRDAVEFASTPIDEWRAEVDQRMRESSEAMDFETAQRHRRQLEATKPATKPAFAYVDRLERFRFIVLASGESADHVRLFAVCGGRIEPIADVARCVVGTVGSSDDDVAALTRNLAMHFDRMPDDLDPDAAAENVGLVCNYLFRARTKRGNLQFVHSPRDVDENDLAKALRSVHRQLRNETDEQDMPDRVTEVAE